jgi:cytochrome c oxidase accessory protein FixG
MENQSDQSEKTRTQRPYFRDTLQTVNESGGRQWIYPKRPKGRLYNFRWLVAIVLLAFFFLAPFMRLNGEPFILLNVLERKFIIFGQVFWPQDFHLLVLSIIILIIFIILFTVRFGRIFCGWACPQTIFMEFIFRQVEYLIEGDAHKQKKLDKKDWDLEKIVRKGLKHLVFFGMALAVITTILAYIVGSDRVGVLISEGPSAHLGTFIIVLIFSGAFYGIYAFFREQVCIIVCPYGRLQGVLLDDKSVVVAYDYKRGEPRAPFRSKEGRSGKGDCIDCNNCVSVCPTGIDIRNGTQLECINCTACIDACNQVMDRVKLPRGLVRYDSEKGISTGVNTLFNARTIAYASFLTLLLIVTVSLFIVRGDVETTILRVPGTLYQEYGPENYSNMYKIQLVNKTRTDMPIELKLITHDGEIVFLGDAIAAVKGQITETTFMIVLNKQLITSSNTPISIGIFSNETLLDTFKTNFLAPNALDKK